MVVAYKVTATHVSNASPSTQFKANHCLYISSSHPHCITHTYLPTYLPTFPSTPYKHTHPISSLPPARTSPPDLKPGVLGAKAKYVHTIAYTISQVPRKLGICSRDCTLRDGHDAWRAAPVSHRACMVRGVVILVDMCVNGSMDGRGVREWDGCGT